jgi:hypothetical protein
MAGRPRRDSTGEEEIESHRVALRFIQIGSRMPGINRSGPGYGQLAIGQTIDDINELAVRG